MTLVYKYDLENLFSSTQLPNHEVNIFVASVSEIPP